MPLPKTYKCLAVREKTNDFQKTVIEEVPLKEPSSEEVVVKIIYVGINASDINFTSGKYAPDQDPPLYPGLEGLGEVVAIGDKVSKLKVGDAVAITSFGGMYAEYAIVHEKIPIKVPKVNPEVIPLMVSGLTASIALKEVGEIKAGQTVLVTAAAGGTGVFAVQLAKLAGCHVIGTCSTDEKVTFLKSLGCDRAINYKKENFAHVMKNEYPEGVDVVYESVGGEFFDICVDSLAVKGKLIVIGAISGYKDGSAFREKIENESKTPLPIRLLSKSASVRGFFLSNFSNQWSTHSMQLFQLHAEGKLKGGLDKTTFRGLQGIKEAVEYMYAGKNSGKVVAQITEDSSKL